MDSNTLIASLKEALPGAQIESVPSVDLQTTMYVSREDVPELARALRDLGWNGFVQVLLFMALLLAGYVYVWRKGALDWGTDGSRS